MKSHTFDTMKKIFHLLMLSVMTLFINVSFAGDIPGKVANENAILIMSDESPVTVINALKCSGVQVCLLNDVKLLSPEVELIQELTNDVNRLKLEGYLPDCIAVEPLPDVITPLKIDATGVLQFKQPQSLFSLARSNC